MSFRGANVNDNDLLDAGEADVIASGRLPRCPRGDRAQLLAADGTLARFTATWLGGATDTPR